MPLNSPSARRPVAMSLMCTSYASKPARSKAAAISTCPLTPCSRRMATLGRAPVAMNGAATSCSGSNVRCGARPGSAASAMRAYSWSAESGLSRSFCIACVVDDHARWRSMRISSSNDDPCRLTVMRPERVGAPTTAASTPAAFAAATTATACPHWTCTTAPNSSANSAASGSPGTWSSVTSTPQRDANTISASVAKRPPSPMS